MTGKVSTVTAYFTAVSDELLPELRFGARLPTGLRLLREVGRIFAPFGGMTLVEFEDDAAPAELAGRTVTPTIQSHYDADGAETHTTVIARDLDSTEYQLLP